MAIDKSLLDDIAPSDSAVSRLKKKPRRIKPWESDILLRSPDEESAAHTSDFATRAGTSSPPLVNTNDVLGTKPELPTEGVLSTDTDVHPDGAKPVKPMSVGSTTSVVASVSEVRSNPKLTPSSVLTTKTVFSSDFELSTETVPPRSLPTYGDKTTNANPAHRIPVLGTDSALSNASVLSTKNGRTTKPILGTDPVVTTRLDAGTEPGQNSDWELRSDEGKKSSEGTKRELGTEEELGYQSVPSTEAESSHQVGAIPKNRRSTQATSGSTRRVQPYVVSDMDNFTRVPHAVTEALQREEFSSRQFRILITILRETIGWGREYAELSAKDFAKKTGIAASHIFITLRDLEDTGAIIRRVNGRNAKNSYALNKGFFAKYPTKRGPEGGSSTSTNSALGTEAVLTTNSVSKLSSDPVRSTHHQSGAIKSDVNCLNSNTIFIGKKDSKKLKNSLHELPEILRPLIETIRPAAKLESEKECAFELLAEYSAEDLADAVIYLQKNGVLGSGLPVHSPFKYLMSAAEQVLAQVSKIRVRSSNTLTTQTPPSDSAQDSDEAVPLFEKALSEEAKHDVPLANRPES